EIDGAGSGNAGPAQHALSQATTEGRGTLEEPAQRKGLGHGDLIVFKRGEKFSAWGSDRFPRCGPPEIDAPPPACACSRRRSRAGVARSAAHQGMQRAGARCLRASTSAQQSPTSDRRVSLASLPYACVV